MFAVRERVLKSFFSPSFASVSIRDGVCETGRTIKSYIASLRCPNKAILII
jgi:hypothetical protein